MAQGAKSQQRQRYWLLTSPRTASNLLVKMLNLDEQGVRPAHNGGYFFLPSVPKIFLINEKPMDTWTHEESEIVNTMLQKCLENFQDHIAAAEQEGQTLYVKEHTLMMTHPQFENHYVHNVKVIQDEAAPLAMRNIAQPTRSPLNLTLFPDEFLKTWNPTFLIRHPALMIPSHYRTCLSDLEMDGYKRPGKKPMAAEITTRWQRALYDFYAEHFANDSIWPIVIDADDVMTCPPLVSKYAQLSGLDESKVRYSWDKVGEQELNKMNDSAKRMLSSINASTKIDTSKVAGNIDIDQELGKWIKEFGEEEARTLEKLVRDAMADYNFLHSKRLRLEQE
ncbi:hypothetical protein BKA59DRAFT_524471 [Fusarium tricinctum]|jgi:hypothetical protein|uniref:P-loop containing nucleoside triphosphate hydrolase protein n=2 Tax=Fusarium tricinctum species complex TaxID=679429 RepID=A0A8K0WE77_9HYPO|nr:hypothetical protein BKA59DRAFT_524471 [Fusarium tricinctum]